MTKTRLVLLLLSVLAFIILAPAHWFPERWRIAWADTFGVPDYQPSARSETPDLSPEVACPNDIAGWRKAQQIAGVSLLESSNCVADNPYAVAAFVRGTNNVNDNVLSNSGLSKDAVEKSDDLDGDGDPDRIHIRLEVIELNGSSPDHSRTTAQYAIAPGVRPGLWVFAPKHLGMSTVNFESDQARELLRAPSPSIRIEQGDEVTITLENSHYMPHTIHFHGVDHAYVDQQGEGNDGVPITSERPVMPGGARSYNIQARQSGTMFYHCHVQPQAHVMMGLQGMFVVEDNEANNWLQTLNVGAGFVRAPSQSSQRQFAREYDLHYSDLDQQLSSIVQEFTDPRMIDKQMHRRYNVTQAHSEYYLLNGRSFPYTFRESLLVAQANEKIKLRVVNGGSTGVALHTHGHKAIVSHLDGVAVPEVARITRDVIWVANAQRVDLELHTQNDGLHSYGPGVWLLHDHQGKAVTNNGIGPGGNLSAIVYQNYLGENGWPQMQGMAWDRFFTPDYYRGEVPVFEFSADKPAQAWTHWLRWLGMVLAASVFLVALFSRSKRA